jgi:hypothetical protein
MLVGENRMIPKPSVKDRVSEMVRDVVGPGMKVAGFRRTGRVFWRNSLDVCHVAHVEMSRWGSSRESSFHVHLGVFWHQVEGILENPSVGKMPPPAYRCTFRIDLGRTISMPPKPTWKVTLASDFHSIGRDVLGDLQQYAPPWFEYRSALNRVLEWKRYTKPEGNGRYSVQELINADAKVVFKIILGQRDSAIADLRRFVENGHTDKALDLAKRLKIPKNKVVTPAGRASAT